MATKYPHLDYHLSKTWEYLSGADPDIYLRDDWTNSSLAHDIFHIIYYGVVYAGAPILAMIVLGFVISAFEESRQ